MASIGNQSQIYYEIMLLLFIFINIPMQNISAADTNHIFSWIQIEISPLYINLRFKSNNSGPN